MTISQIAIAKAQTSINVHQAALDVAKADKATAEWKLSRTNVRVADRRHDQQPHRAHRRHRRP